MSKLLTLSLFYLSFLPLWVSVLFITSKSIFENTENLYTEYVCVGTIVACLLISISILLPKLYSTSNQSSIYELSGCKKEKVITSEFLLSYILPLFAFDFTTWDGVTLFLIFFATLAFLSVKYSYLSINVFLEIIGYKAYNAQVKLENTRTLDISIISKKDLTKHIGESIKLISLNNDVKLYNET